MGRTDGFTKEQIKFIKDNFDKYSYSELARRFNIKFNENKTEASMNSKAKRLGLRKAKNQTRFTKEQEKWLKENASKYFRKELVVEFNKKFNTNKTYDVINQKCFRLKARGKTIDDWRKENGSWHKGMHGEEYKSHFAKNHFNKHLDKVRIHYTPHKIVMVKDRGKQRPYIVLDNNDKKYHKNVSGMIPYARYVYEQKIRRPLQSNEYVIHLDGDVTNCDLDNLVLVSNNVACMLFSRGWSKIEHKEIMKIAIKECEFEQKIRKVSKERK